MKIFNIFLTLVIFIITNPPIKAIAKINEIRSGLMQHNVGIVKKQGGKENGPDLEGQIIFDKIDLLKKIGNPKSMIAINLNSAGETSFAAIGMNWQKEFSQNWIFSPSFGYAIHSGSPLENPYQPWESDARLKFEHEELALGSRDLFWSQIAIGRKISKSTKIYIAYEHLSHGYIIGNGVNQGLDNIGVLYSKTY
jgi:lipid A 3-O-deacylase